MPGGPARDLCHPLPLCAVAVLVANDHWWKAAYPSWATGKISDVAGLFFFPLVIAALLRLVVSPRYERAIAAGASLATAAAFTLLKLHAGFNGWVADVWAPNVMDATDLLALPSTGLSFVWMRWRWRIAYAEPARARAVVQVTALAAAALASVATSRSPVTYPRNYPSWEITGTKVREIGCGRVVAWVSKSGKQGVGLSLAVTEDRAPCELHVVSAALVIGGARIPAAPTVRDGAGNLYVPFAFDNEAKWNADDRRGELELEVESMGERARWIFAARHLRDEPHRKVYRDGRRR